MGISRIFDISRRSLSVYQKALDVTAHNISNSGNEDYSRQRITISSEVPEQNGSFYWGVGVKIDDISRVRNSVTDVQINKYNQNYSMNNKESEILAQVEQIFSEPSELGLSNLLNSFFNSWQELSVSPNSIPLRENLVHVAQNLSTKIDSVNDELDTLRGDILAEAKADVNKINSTLKQIEELNREIHAAKSTGINPNDLLDQRDKLVSDLSNVVNVNVTYDQNGAAIISIGGIFAADLSSSIEFGLSVEGDKLKLVSKDTGKSAVLKGGELAGLAELFNNTIPGYKGQIDILINTLVEQVNATHEAGYNILEPPQKNVKFFDGYVDDKLVINPDIVEDPKKIAVSADGTAGNGDLAVEIANLAGKKLIDGSTISESYSSLINKLGNDKASNDQAAKAGKLILEQLNIQKASYSGVSVDEELTNIIKYQRSYDASAKLIKISDEMLKTLMNLV